MPVPIEPVIVDKMDGIRLQDDSSLDAKNGTSETHKQQQEPQQQQQQGPLQQQQQSGVQQCEQQQQEQEHDLNHEQKHQVPQKEQEQQLEPKKGLEQQEPQKEQQQQEQQREQAQPVLQKGHEQLESQKEKEQLEPQEEQKPQKDQEKLDLANEQLQNPDQEQEIEQQQQLRTLVYEEMSQASRTMHYHDFQTCTAKRQFIASKVSVKYQTALPKTGKYVWFRAQSAEDTAEKHDWFGNVRCSFDVLQLLKKDPKINMFNIDCAYFGYSSASRILLTYKKTYHQYKMLKLDKLKYGDPLNYKDGKLLFLKKDVSRDQSWWGNHQTEFVIDTQTIGARKLFNVCEKYAVNHSCANRVSKRGSFVSHQCLIYNSARRKECPSPWTQEHTHSLLHPSHEQNNSNEHGKKAETVVLQVPS